MINDYDLHGVENEGENRELWRQQQAVGLWWMKFGKKYEFSCKNNYFVIMSDIVL